MNITEVAPRDGLQSLPFALSVNQRAELVRQLVGAGLQKIEVTSFAHPALVPQHADAERLCFELEDLRDDGVELAAYVPNSKGLARALRCGAISKVGFAVGATDEMTLHNTRMRTRDAIAEIEPLLPHARQKGVVVMGAVSAAFGCPFTGWVGSGQVLETVNLLIDAGCDSIQIADTIGTGTPRRVAELAEKISEQLPGVPVSWHFHDTFGMGLANVSSIARFGFEDVDASTGGIGGCPFAPGAAGNVATEEVAYAFGDSRVDVVGLAAIGRTLHDWAASGALSKIALVGDVLWRDEFLAGVGRCAR